MGKVQHKACSTRKECNMKRVHKRYNIKTVQHEKRCDMKRVQHEKSATQKKCNTKRVQHEKSATQK